MWYEAPKNGMETRKNIAVMVWKTDHHLNIGKSQILHLYGTLFCVNQ
jgi:hypothetical protein